MNIYNEEIRADSTDSFSFSSKPVTIIIIIYGEEDLLAGEEDLLA